MFRIKICGIRRADDARCAVEAGADAIGLNFCPSSPRFTNRDEAQVIAAALEPGIVKVGIFAGASVDEIRSTHDAVRLDLVQLHGDEPPEFVAQLNDLPLIRALRCATSGIDHIVGYVDRCRELGVELRLLLLDAARPGRFGGTGQLADWETASRCSNDERLPPLVLAGGLTPENVAEAISAVRPAAVDVSSGVESAPGEKSPELIKAFVEHARAALEQLH